MDITVLPYATTNDGVHDCAVRDLRSKDLRARDKGLLNRGSWRLGIRDLGGVHDGAIDDPGVYDEAARHARIRRTVWSTELRIVRDTLLFRVTHATGDQDDGYCGVHSEGFGLVLQRFLKRILSRYRTTHYGCCSQASWRNHHRFITSGCHFMFHGQPSAPVFVSGNGCWFNNFHAINSSWLYGLKRVDYVEISLDKLRMIFQHERKWHVTVIICFSRVFHALVSNRLLRANYRITSNLRPWSYPWFLRPWSYSSRIRPWSYKREGKTPFWAGAADFNMGDSEPLHLLLWSQAYDEHQENTAKNGCLSYLYVWP